MEEKTYEEGLRILHRAGKSHGCRASRSGRDRQSQCFLGFKQSSSESMRADAIYISYPRMDAPLLEKSSADIMKTFALDLNANCENAAKTAPRPLANYVHFGCLHGGPVMRYLAFVFVLLLGSSPAFADAITVFGNTPPPGGQQFGPPVLLTTTGSHLSPPTLVWITCIRRSFSPRHLTRVR